MVIVNINDLFKENVNHIYSSFYLSFYRKYIISVLLRGNRCININRYQNNHSVRTPATALMHFDTSKHAHIFKTMKTASVFDLT